MKLFEMLEHYRKRLPEELAKARVCQDIILKALSDGPLSRNVTIKGGVVMQNVTGSNRRATRDIDLDFIRYSLTDDKIKSFVSSLNCLNGISITILGPIIELKHENYRGRRIEVSISDGEDTIKSKLDIGIHKHLELKQKEYCFDVCMDDEGASLLINSQEQMFAEKLYSLLKLGIYSERYKDIYDMYFLARNIDTAKLKNAVKILIFDDSEMRENTLRDIIDRISYIFGNKDYIKKLNSARQKWIDENAEAVTETIINCLKQL